MKAHPAVPIRAEAQCRRFQNLLFVKDKTAAVSTLSAAIENPPGDGQSEPIVQQLFEVAVQRVDNQWPFEDRLTRTPRVGPCLHGLRSRHALAAAREVRPWNVGHDRLRRRRFLFVFSSNAHPFESEHGYSKFSAFVLLEYGGDFVAAARALAERDFGKQIERRGALRIEHVKPSLVSSSPLAN